MGTLLGLIFCALVIGGQMLTVQSSVYSSPDTSLRFSQCLIEKMSESQFFTSEDRNNMMEVANVMAQAVLDKELTIFSGKMLATAFVTSMADVIILEDIAINTYRKGIYTAALEQCSLSSTGYIDTEFINEALRIMSVIEHSKVPKFGEAGAFGRIEFPVRGTYEANLNPQISGILNPFAIQPSPVQYPYAPELLDPNVKTIFEPPEYPYSSPFSASQSGMNSQYQVQSAIKTGFLDSDANKTPQSGGFYSGSHDSSISQPERFPSGYVASSMSQLGDFPSGTDVSDISQPESFTSSSDASGMSHSVTFSSISDTKSILQPGSDFADVSSSKVPQKGSNINFSDTYQASFGGLNIPQTKESSIVVIPATNHQQPVQDVNLPGHSPPETGEIMYKPTSVENSPGPQESTFFMTSSASLPQAVEQDSNIPSSPTFENIVLNILTNSSTFREAFNPGIPHENAINLARSITKQSLAGYDVNMINEALAAVSDEVARVSFSSPENYALALSNAMISVLKQNNLPLFAVGSQIARSFLSYLDSTSKLSSQSENVGERFKVYIPGQKVNFEWEEKQTDFDFQSPPLSPEDIDEEIFSKVLAHYLSNSDKIASFFCSSNVPEDRIQVYFFSAIKFSLVQYGPQVSSIAASTVVGHLSDLSEKELCLNYAQTTSEIIAEIFDENGVHNANAEDIANKIESSLSKQQITTIEPQKPGSAPDNFPLVDTGAVLYESIPTLQSSFSPNSDPSSRDVNASSSVFYEPSTNYMTQSFENTNYKTSDGFDEGKYQTRSISLSAPPRPIQMSSTEETRSEYQRKMQHTSPATTAYITEISNEEFTNAMALVETIISLSEAFITENPKKTASDDVMDQEEFAEYLFGEFESALEAYNYKDSEQEEPSVPPEKNLTTTENVINSESGNTRASVEEIRSQSEGGNPQDMDVNHDHPTSLDSEIKDKGSHHQTGSETEIEGKVDSLSGDSVKMIHVELQPSFQGPLSQSTNSQTSTVLQPNSGTVAYDSDHEDASLAFARTVSEIVTSSIAYIRFENFYNIELCARLNELAPIVNIPPLDYCEEAAAIDYLLNVLLSVIKILKGV